LDADRTSRTDSLEWDKSDHHSKLPKTSHFYKNYSQYSNNSVLSFTIVGIAGDLKNEDLDTLIQQQKAEQEGKLFPKDGILFFNCESAHRFMYSNLPMISTCK